MPTGKLDLVPDTETGTLPSGCFSPRDKAMNLSLIWTPTSSEIWLPLGSQCHSKTSLGIPDDLVWAKAYLSINLGKPMDGERYLGQMNVRN